LKEYYLVMDGRAHYDVTEAYVLEVVGDVPKDMAWKALDEHDGDCVLVKYDYEGINGSLKLRNPEVMFR